jgi:hypothetical protein
MRPVPTFAPIAKCGRLAETNEAAPDDARRQMRRVRRRAAWRDLPSPNPVRPGPGPEKRLHDLQRRFRAVSAPDDRAITLWRYYRSGTIAALLAIVAFAIVWGLSSSPWPITTTLRHIASAPNCAFARLVGLAPARRGQPGYWERHDRDRDGIACETIAASAAISRDLAGAASRPPKGSSGQAPTRRRSN